MPVVYRIDKASNIVRVRGTGNVTIGEVIAHFRELEKDPDCPERLDVVLDLTEQTSIPRAEYLREIAFEIGRIRKHVRFGACGIAAGTDALFGMLRMFEVFAERYFSKSRVFRTVAEAEAWMASQHPTTSAAG